MAARTKESALDLSKFVDKSIRVKLAGGREGAQGSACGRRSESPVLLPPPLPACLLPACPRHRAI